MVCSPFGQFSNFVYPKLKIQFSTEVFTPRLLPRERLSNLASSFENTPSGGGGEGVEKLEWNEGLSKQHNKNTI
jgi:hypothetical protein